MFRLLTNIKNSISLRGKPLSQRLMTMRIRSNDLSTHIDRELPDSLSKVGLYKMLNQLRAHNIPSSNVDATGGIRIDTSVYNENYDAITTLHGLISKTTTSVNLRNVLGDEIEMEIEALNTKPLDAIIEAFNKPETEITCKMEPYTHGSNPRLFVSSKNPELPNMVKQVLDNEKNKEELSTRLRLSRE